MLLNNWPDFGSSGNEWMELARRVYNTLFSEHARAREKQLHKSIEIATHGRCFHQLRRDRRNEAELRAAWSRGERTYKGKRMGGGATCPYVYRWERDEVMEVVEMIEQVLREEGTEEMTAPIALPQEVSPAVDIQEQQIKITWTALQVAEEQLEKRGLAFGKALYEFRAASEVVSGGTTFRSTLDKLGIPHSTAYRWIAKYEESIGTRAPKPIPVVIPQTTRGILELVEEASSPAVPTSTVPAVSREEQDREQLGFAVKRLDSINKAMHQVVGDEQRWSQYDEYADVMSQAKKIAGLVTTDAKAEVDKRDPYAYFEQFKAEPQTMGDEIAAMLVEFKLDQQQIKEVLHYAEMSAKRTLNQLQTAVAA